jgi:hypothetical protein
MVLDGSHELFADRDADLHLLRRRGAERTLVGQVEAMAVLVVLAIGPREAEDDTRPSLNLGVDRLEASEDRVELAKFASVKSRSSEKR